MKSMGILAVHWAIVTFGLNSFRYILLPAAEFNDVTSNSLYKKLEILF